MTFSGGARPLVLLLTLTVAVAVLAGCASARRSEPVLGYAVPLGAEAEQGRLVFATYCHSCHPGGEAGLAPAINDKALPRFLKRFQVRHGLGAMPSFSREVIDDEQLDALLEYMRALRRRGR